MKMLNILFVIFVCLIPVLSISSCGIDKTLVSTVYEGRQTLENYPWLGILYYPLRKRRLTTAVVLVTRQIVLAAATEIDQLPKDNFRALARVTLGNNCTGPSIGIRDYTYHPDFSSTTYSALAIIQLETDLTKIELRPICPPPTYFKNPQFYAMVMSENCKDSKIMIHKMKYVSPGACKSYYRRSGLDVDSLWPTHTACARSMTGGKCIWRSGAVLAVKVRNRWSLLGFGVYGPGCQAPARFLDYGMYHSWVKRSVAKIGKTAITTMADNHIILRRMSSSLQRFGKCDLEETQRELYTDKTMILHTTNYNSGVVTYNVTLVTNVDYSCVIFQAAYTTRLDYGPKLRLRRWCAGPLGICYGLGHISMDFFVQIYYRSEVEFKVSAYGREIKLVDPYKSYYLMNEKKQYPYIYNYNAIKSKIKRDNYQIKTWFMPNGKGGGGGGSYSSDQDLEAYSDSSK